MSLNGMCIVLVLILQLIFKASLICQFKRNEYWILRTEEWIVNSEKVVLLTIIYANTKWTWLRLHNLYQPTIGLFRGSSPEQYPSLEGRGWNLSTLDAWPWPDCGSCLDVSSTTVKPPPHWGVEPTLQHKLFVFSLKSNASIIYRSVVKCFHNQYIMGI